MYRYIPLEGMVKTTIEVDDDLDRRFREAVAKDKGFRKGSLSIALQEAMEEWIRKVESGKKHERK